MPLRFNSTVKEKKLNACKFRSTLDTNFREEFVKVEGFRLLTRKEVKLV